MIRFCKGFLGRMRFTYTRREDLLCPGWEGAGATPARVQAHLSRCKGEFDSLTLHARDGARQRWKGSGNRPGSGEVSAVVSGGTIRKTRATRIPYRPGSSSWRGGTECR